MRLYQDSAAFCKPSPCFRHCSLTRDSFPQLEVFSHHRCSVTSRFIHQCHISASSCTPTSPLNFPYARPCRDLCSRDKTLQPRSKRLSANLRLESQCDLGGIAFVFAASIETAESTALVPWNRTVLWANLNQTLGLEGLCPISGDGWTVDRHRRTTHGIHGKTIRI